MNKCKTMFAVPDGVLSGEMPKKARKSSSFFSPSATFSVSGVLGSDDHSAVPASERLDMSLSPALSGGKLDAAGVSRAEDGLVDSGLVGEKLRTGVARRQKKGATAYGYGFSSAQVARWQAAARDGGASFRFYVGLFYRCTSSRLDDLARRVRECRCVGEANDFCRFLNLMGLPAFLERFKHLIADYSPLNPRIRDLMSQCGEHFRAGRADPRYAASDIAEINEKLSVLASVFAKTGALSSEDLSRFLPSSHSDEVQRLSPEPPALEGPANPNLGGLARNERSEV